MQQDKDTTGVNFQMKNNLYRRMKIKLAMNQGTEYSTIKDYISHLVELDLNADKRITKG